MDGSHDSESGMILIVLVEKAYMYLVVWMRVMVGKFYLWMKMEIVRTDDGLCS